MSKPRLFIGSSVEGLEIAYAIQENLKYVAETTVWDQGVFNLSESSLESLLTILESSDFGAFVFSPDDYIKIRGKKDLAVRDNVLFELGLFVGKLGRKRSFIIVPDNKEFHLPTDLIGMTPGKYEANRSDNNMNAGTGSASHKIRDAIKKLGALNITNEAPEITSNIINEQSKKKDDWLDYMFHQKNYDKAIELLKKKLRYTKNIDEKIYIKGWICYAVFKKDPIIGTKEYETLIADNISNSVAYVPYLDNLFWNSSYKKGIEICDKALLKCDNKLNINNFKARFLWSMNLKVDAIRLLEETLVSTPDPQLFINLSDNYKEINDNKKAFDVLHHAFHVFPNNESLMYKFAMIAYDINQKEICVFLYLELLRIRPDNSSYWCLLGNAYLDLQLENLALTSYEKACDLAKNKESWIFGNLGNLYNNKALFDKAEMYLKTALTIDDKSDYTHNRLSSVYESKQEESKKVNAIIAIAKEKINSDNI